MAETVNHVALTTHSAPFALGGGIYTISVTAGTIAHGSDAIEFQRQVNGGYVSIDPAARFLNRDIGAARLSKLLPAGQYRWTIPGSMHNINTSVVKAS